MGKAISDISNGINNVGSQVGNRINGYLGNVEHDVRGFVKNPIHGSLQYGTNIFTAGRSGTIGGGDSASDAPPAATDKTDLQKFQEKQTQNASDFRANLPKLQEQQAGLLKEQANNQMSGQLKAIKERASSRGLGYGGLAEGAQAGVRNANQGALSSALSTSNANLANAADTLDAQAVQTGLGVQQNQQALQNLTYQQAMADYQQKNNMFSNMLGSGLLAAAVFL